MALLGCYNGNANNLSCFYLTVSETNGFIHGYMTVTLQETLETVKLHHHERKNEKRESVGGRL
jgi:hypothetical protein